MIGSLDLLQGEEIDINDFLTETCYCPGDEYVKLVPKLAEAIFQVFREQSRTSADIYRLPITTRQAGIPEVDVLKGIKKFSNYTRSQLLDINSTHLDILAEEAKEAMVLSQQMNNQTRMRVEQTYLEIQQEMLDFKYNMSLRKQIIEEAQAAANPSLKRRRKREGFFFSLFTYIVMPNKNI